MTNTNSKNGRVKVTRVVTTATGKKIQSHAAYMASDVWTQRKLRYWRKHPKVCAACGAATSKKFPTHLHHRTYERMGIELDSDFSPLCEPCHAKVHYLHRKTNSRTLSLAQATDRIIEAGGVPIAERRAGTLHAPEARKRDRGAAKVRARKKELVELNKRTGEIPTIPQTRHEVRTVNGNVVSKSAYKRERRAAIQAARAIKKREAEEALKAAGA